MTDNQQFAGVCHLQKKQRTAGHHGRRRPATNRAGRCHRRLTAQGDVDQTNVDRVVVSTSRPAALPMCRTWKHGATASGEAEVRSQLTSRDKVELVLHPPPWKCWAGWAAMAAPSRNRPCCRPTRFC